MLLILLNSISARGIFFSVSESIKKLTEKYSVKLLNLLGSRFYRGVDVDNVDFTITEKQAIFICYESPFPKQYLR